MTVQELSDEHAAAIRDGIRKTVDAMLFGDAREEMLQRTCEEHVRMIDEAGLLTANLIEAIAVGDGSADPTPVAEWGDNLEKSVALIKIGAAIGNMALRQLNFLNVICIPNLCLLEVETLNEFYGDHVGDPLICAAAVNHAWNMIILDPEHDPMTCEAGESCSDFVMTRQLLEYVTGDYDHRPGMVYFAVIRLAAAMWREAIIDNEEEDDE